MIRGRESKLTFPLKGFINNLTNMKCSHCGAEIEGKLNEETGKIEYKEYVLSDEETRCDKCKG